MSEYISLSTAVHNVIPLMETLDKFWGYDYNMVSIEPDIYCKAFEDNSGAFKIARLPNMRPCTKSIKAVYHHFQEYVHHGIIIIYP